MRDPQPLRRDPALEARLEALSYVVCPHVVDHPVEICPGPAILHGEREWEAYRLARRILDNPTSDLFDRASATAMLEYLPPAPPAARPVRLRR